MSRGKDVHRAYGYLAPLSRHAGRLSVLLYVAKAGAEGCWLGAVYREFPAKKVEEVRRVVLDLADHGWLALERSDLRIRFDVVTRLQGDVLEAYAAAGLVDHLRGAVSLDALAVLDPVYLRAEALRFPAVESGWLQLPALALFLSRQLGVGWEGVL